MSGEVEKKNPNDSSLGFYEEVEQDGQSANKQKEMGLAAAATMFQWRERR